MKAPRGFTLAELMIVVAIIGILSVLSITGYKKVMSKSRLAEGHNVVSGVKIAQDQYFAETGRYADIGWTNLCPQGVSMSAANIPSNTATGWNPACDGGTGVKWSRLAYSPDGAIRFGVMTTAMAAGTTAHPVVPSSDGKVDLMVAGVPTRSDFTDPTSAPKPWYAIAAVADLDGDRSDTTKYTTIYTTSLNTQIWVDREGE